MTYVIYNFVRELAHAATVKNYGVNRGVVHGMPCTTWITCTLLNDPWHRPRASGCYHGP